MTRAFEKRALFPGFYDDENAMKAVSAMKAMKGVSAMKAMKGKKATKPAKVMIGGQEVDTAMPIVTMTLQVKTAMKTMKATKQAKQAMSMKAVKQTMSVKAMKAMKAMKAYKFENKYFSVPGEYKAMKAMKKA